MKLHYDLLRARIGGVRLVLKDFEHTPTHPSVKTAPALPLRAFAASRDDFHELRVTGKPNLQKNPIVKLIIKDQKNHPEPNPETSDSNESRAL